MAPSRKPSRSRLMSRPRPPSSTTARVIRSRFMKLKGYLYKICQAYFCIWITSQILCIQQPLQYVESVVSFKVDQIGKNSSESRQLRCHSVIHSSLAAATRWSGFQPTSESTGCQPISESLDVIPSFRSKIVNFTVIWRNNLPYKYRFSRIEVIVEYATWT